MNKMFRKTAAFVLAAAIMVSASGCGGGKQKETQTASESTASVAETTSQAKKDPITLTLFSGQLANDKTTPGVQNDPVANYIKEKTGITIDLQIIPNEEERKTKLAAMLASGDMTDMMVVGVSNNESTSVLNAGAVIDLEPLLANAPTFKNDPRIAFSKKYLSGDKNKLFFIPGLMGPDGESSSIDVGYTVRWDLYEKIGYPEADTLNDLIPIFKKMQDLEPKNAEGKKVYALGFYTDWGLWPFIGITSVNCGISNDSFPGQMEVNMTTHEVRSIVTTPESTLWQGIDFFNAAYREGILDPDSGIQKWDQYLAKHGQNRYLASYPNWNGINDSKAAFEKAGLKDKKGWAPMPPLKKSKTVMFGRNYLYGKSDYLWCVTKNCKNPERAVQLLDFLNNEDEAMVIWNGIKGKDWDVENGVPKIKPEFLAAAEKDFTTNATQTGAFKYYNMPLKNMGYIHSKYNTPIHLFKTTEILARDYSPEKDPWMYKMIQHYNVKTQTELYKKGNYNIVPDDRMVNSILKVAPDDIKLIDEKVDKYLQSEAYKVVFIKDQKQYEAAKKKIVDDCKAMGIEKSIEFWTKNFADAYKELDSLKK